MRCLQLDYRASKLHLSLPTGTHLTEPTEARPDAGYARSSGMYVFGSVSLRNLVWLVQ